MSLIDTWWVVASVDGGRAQQVAAAFVEPVRETPPSAGAVTWVRDLVASVGSGKALFPEHHPSVLLWGCEVNWGTPTVFLKEAAPFFRALWAPDAETGEAAVLDFESILFFAQTEMSHAEVWECHPTGVMCVQDTEGDRPLEMFWLWQDAPLERLPLTPYEDL